MTIPSLPAAGANWSAWATSLDTEARTIAGKQDTATLGATVAADATVRAALGPATQRAGLRLAGGGSAATITGAWNLHARTLFRFPVKPTRMRVHVWNRDVKGGGVAVTPGALTFSGMYVGESVPDATGAPTSAFVAAPTQVSGQFVTPADGATESVTPWTTINFAAGKDLLLSYGMRSPSGQVHQRSVGAMWFFAHTISDDLAAAAQVLNPSLSTTGTTWFDMWIEYETKDGASHGLLLGDSLTVGNNATYPHRDGYAGFSSGDLGYAATVAAWSGSNIAVDWTAASPKWASVAAVSKPSWIDIGLGSNDLGNSQTLAQLQASLGGLIAQVRSIHADVPIYVRTIMPRGFTGAQETDRLAFNTWLRSRPFSIAGMFDIAVLVTNTATGNSLLAAYNAGDGIHLNTEGYRLIATACRPPLRYVQSAG